VLFNLLNVFGNQEISRRMSFGNTIMVN